MRYLRKTAVLRERTGYVLLAGFCWIASVLLGWTGPANRINHIFSDLFFRQRGSRPPAGEIVIVAIDDATLSRYGALPLNRSLLAQGIRFIQQARPRLLAVDLLLAEGSTPESDRELEMALGGEERPGSTASVPGEPREENDPELSGAVPVVLATALEADSGGRWLDPLPAFAQRAAAIGHVHADPDGDGVSRQVLLEKQGNRLRYWALALESFRAFQGTGQEPVLETQDTLEIPLSGGAPSVARVPATRTGQRALLINYAGREGTFPRVGFAEMIREPQQRELLRGKIVLLGVTAQGAGDRLFTPFSSGAGMPGVEVHANLLHTLLRADYLLSARDRDVVLAALAITVLTAWALAGFHGFVQAVLLTGVGLAILTGSYAQFLWGRVWPAFSLLLPYGTTLLLCGTYQLRRVRRKFAESEAKRQRSQQRFQMIAHEIRTPLTAIQGSSELLARYALEDSKREQMLRLIYGESQRLGKWVERFLTVEKLSAAEVELERAAVDLSSLLSGTLERLRPTAERKGIELVREDQVPRLAVEADADLLEFALSNLLTNAIKYSPPGTCVRLVLESKDGQARIRVSDSGPGLTPEQKRRVFDRFYRTEAAERSEAPGFGLGLAIAREIALHHGGDLRVEAEAGSGSHFTLHLPILASAEKGHRTA